MYLHGYLSGIHSAGSRSPLDRLDEAVTAIKVLPSVRSLAYASRCAGFQLRAPESHASANGTMWSMSKAFALVFVTPSYWLTHLPDFTVQLAVTFFFDSCRSTSARAFWQSRSTSSHSLN